MRKALFVPSCRNVYLLCVALCLSWTSSARTDEKIVHVQLKQPAPYFILPTWDGNTLKSTALKGKVVIMEFFQTWCPDCQKSTLELEKLYQKYKEKGLVVVAVSHDREKAEIVGPFVKKQGLTFPVLLGDHSIAMSYLGVTPQKPSFRIPYVVVIDREGDIVGQFEEGKRKEATDVDLLEELVKKLF